MRSLQKFAVLVCAGLALPFLSACGTTSAENAALAGAQLEGSKARVKIYRTSEFLAVGDTARIKLDGREIASLGVGGSTILDVPAGSHKISVDSHFHPNVYELTLSAQPGTHYALEVSPNAGSVMAGAVFGVAGMLAETAANEKKGGTFQVRVVDAKSAKS